VKRIDQNRQKARTRDSLQALSKLGELVDGRYRIVSQPPIVVPARELASAYSLSPDEVQHAIQKQFRAYRATLRDDVRDLLERFHVVDVARKVVGVGSVGTRAFIVLLEGRDAGDRLSLPVSRPAVRSADSRSYQNAVGRLCAPSSVNQATRPCRSATQSDTSAVFPHPGPPHTKVDPRRAPSSSVEFRRDRRTNLRGTGGRFHRTTAPIGVPTPAAPLPAVL
jgi:hypothetical protein